MSERDWRLFLKDIRDCAARESRQNDENESCLKQR